MTTYRMTPELRWEERIGPKRGEIEIIRVMQQAYAPIEGGPLYWVDVPVVVDEYAAAVLKAREDG